jgi:CRISPR/Cas system-associated exonuclease Cas4 (RecB family)
MGKSRVEIKELLVSALHAREKARPRSTQVQIGPSELGSCRRKVWYKLNDQPETNENELKLAAIMGTAIHSAIEKALENNKEVMLESVVEHNGMKAHVDCFIPSTGDVVDWKTVKAKNLSYFPSLQQRWQVHTYGYLIEQSGLGKVHNVHLVAIPRDGDERDIKVHSEPYDPNVALEALNWLEAIKVSTDAPAPEKDANYCKFYCKYYDASGEMGCVGLKKENTKTEYPVIEDSEADTHALEYLQLDARIKELTERKDALKESLTGLLGVTKSGIQVQWSTVKGTFTVDKDEVKEKLGYIPGKEGKESIRLSVKQIGGQ